MLEKLWFALCPFTFVVFRIEPEEEEWGYFVEME